MITYRIASEPDTTSTNGVPILAFLMCIDKVQRTPESTPKFLMSIMSSCMSRLENFVILFNHLHDAGPSQVQVQVMSPIYRTRSYFGVTSWWHVTGCIFLRSLSQIACRPKLFHYPWPKVINLWQLEICHLLHVDLLPKYSMFSALELATQQGGVGIRMPDQRSVGKSSHQAWKKKRTLPKRRFWRSIWHNELIRV